MPVAAPIIMAAAAIGGLIVQGVQSHNQKEAAKEQIAMAKEQSTQDLKIKRAGLYQQAVAQKQAMASAYSANFIKANKAEQEMSDPVAFTRHNAPHRLKNERRESTERDHAVSTAFNKALPQRKYGNPRLS